jgi:hypothetical protein
MIDRSKEYCQWRDLKILICSWNIDASKPAAQDANGGADRRLFESWLTSMDQEGPPDIISVGFQEIVDLESKKMTASKFGSRNLVVSLCSANISFSRTKINFLHLSSFVNATQH